MAFTRMLPLMAIETLTGTLAKSALTGTAEIRVISQTHRVHPANTVKRRF
jgi:hypothetical protein